MRQLKPLVAFAMALFLRGANGHVRVQPPRSTLLALRSQEPLLCARAPFW